MFYWKIKTSPIGYDVYFKTNNSYIPEVIIELAVKSKDLHASFAETATVSATTEEEYFEHCWE